jgi:hypothetical protein
MKFRNTLAWLSIMVLTGVGLQAHAAQSAGGKIVCWKDAAGKVIGCGDKVPNEYLDRGTKVFDKQGNVRKSGESAEEAAARQAREKEQAAAREQEKRIALERKRHDEALLNTFTNEQEIDLKRDRELQALNNFIAQQKAALKGANARHDEARKRADEYEKAKKPLPPAVKDDLARAEREKNRIEADITAREKAKVDTAATYAQYRKRYLELKGGAAAAVTPATTTQTSAAASAKK